MKFIYLIGLFIGAILSWSTMISVVSYKFNKNEDEMMRCFYENKKDSSDYYHVKALSYLELEGNMVFKLKKLQP